MTQVRVARQNVAFFRNMNLGQRRSHSPTSAELIGAFAGAGASTARNVQSNGTVVFDGPRPRALARDVVQRLGPVCGYTDAVMVRPRSWVLALAEELLAAIAEIGGAWLIWQGVREHKGLVWIGAGVIALGLYGFVATLQPDAHFGRILAAYGGVFVAGSLIWGMVADGFRPDRWDITGALICLVGVAIIMYAPRGAVS